MSGSCRKRDANPGDAAATRTRPRPTARRVSDGSVTVVCAGGARARRAGSPRPLARVQLDRRTRQPAVARRTRDGGGGHGGERAPPRTRSARDERRVFQLEHREARALDERAESMPGEREVVDDRVGVPLPPAREWAEGAERLHPRTMEAGVRDAEREQPARRQDAVGLAKDRLRLPGLIHDVDERDHTERAIAEGSRPASAWTAPRPTPW